MGGGGCFLYTAAAKTSQHTKDKIQKIYVHKIINIPKLKVDILNTLKCTWHLILDRTIQMTCLKVSIIHFTKRFFKTPKSLEIKRKMSGLG